jgi:Zn-dependent protease
MVGGGIPIGRIFGISIRIHISWFIIFGLVTWLLTVTFPPQWTLTTRVIAALITSILFFASVLLHELMHSVVAIRNKIPVSSITLFIFGGVSQITEEPHEPGMEFRIAAAGPATSLGLGGIMWGLWLVIPSSADVVRGVINWLAYINLALGAFNLIPAFPMDGGRVFRSIIWWRTRDIRRSTRIASQTGRFIALLFIFVGIYLFFFTAYGFNGLWLALIGWFLYTAASSSYRQLILTQALQGHSAKEIMTRDCSQIQPDMNIDKLVNDVVLPSGKRCFIVATDNDLQGMITLQEIKDVPQAERATRTTGQIMKPLTELKTVTPDEDLGTVMRILTEQNVNQVPVVEKGKLVGMIGRDNLLNFINMKESVSS